MLQPRTLLLLLMLAAAGVSSACVLAVETQSVPASRPSPDAGPLSRDEVAHIAARVAQARGYQDFRITEIEREDDERWEVEIAGWLEGQRGEMEIVVDGWDGRLLKISDKRQHREHDDEDEGDD